MFPAIPPNPRLSVGAIVGAEQDGWSWAGSPRRRFGIFREPGRYNDGDGLFLELAGPNKGNWQLRATINGRRRDIGLGSLSLVSLKDAREAAFELRRDIQRGIDPVAERRRRKVEILTFKKAALRVHSEQKPSWKNGKHQEQWIATLERYAFPLLGNRLVNDIEGPLVREVLLPIWLDKPETARRVKQRIGVVLDWAYANGMRPTEAPVRSLSRVLPKQPRKDAHFAALPYDDVPAFMTHLRRGLSVPRLALEFLIPTAARSGEVRGAKWAEIDLEAGLWTVPTSRMKMGKDPYDSPLRRRDGRAGARQAVSCPLHSADLSRPGYPPSAV
jgi:hypothetical protein